MLAGLDKVAAPIALSKPVRFDYVPKTSTFIIGEQLPMVGHPSMYAFWVWVDLCGNEIGSMLAEGVKILAGAFGNERRNEIPAVRRLLRKSLQSPAPFLPFLP